MARALLLLGLLATLAVATNVLFVGNSFTYVNDLPGQFQHISESLGKTVYVNSSVIGGCTLYYQSPLRDDLTATLIEEGDYDFVVLQDFSQLPTVQGARNSYMYKAVDEFDEFVTANSTKFVLYNTWGYHDGTRSDCPSSDTSKCFPFGTLASMTQPPCDKDKSYHSEVGTFDCMTYSLARGYLSVLDAVSDSMRSRTRLAACGPAWQVARGSPGISSECVSEVDAEYEHPLPEGLSYPLAVPTHEATADIELYLPASSGNGWDKHPTAAGQYLNALVFYATVFGESPVGATWSPKEAGLSESQILGLQQVAESVVLDYKQFWNLH